MNEIYYSVIASLLAGVAVPLVFYFAKKSMTSKVSHKRTLLKIIDENGKIKRLMHVGNLSAESIQPLLMEEYLFEDKVEKILNNYKKTHANFNFQRNHSVDFIIELNSKIIALEVKTKLNQPSNKYLDFLKKSHPDVNELMFLFNSEIPTEYLDIYKDKKEVKFISSPREKGLAEKLFNVLDSLGAVKA